MISDSSIKLGTNVFDATLPREFDLPAPLLEPCFAIFVERADTSGAGHPLAIVRRRQVLAAQWTPAGMALRVAACFEVMIHCHALVEHEALAAPFAVRGRHVLEVLEYPAAQMIDLVEAPAL